MITFIIYCVTIQVLSALTLWLLPGAAMHVFNLKGTESGRIKAYMAFAAPFLIIAGLTAGVGMLAIGLLMIPIMRASKPPPDPLLEQKQKKREELMKCQKHHVELCRSGNTVQGDRRQRHYICPFTGEPRYGIPPGTIPGMRKYADDDY